MSVQTVPVISLIRGDGIGPEISEAVQMCIRDSSMAGARQK